MELCILGHVGECGTQSLKVRMPLPFSESYIFTFLFVNIFYFFIYVLYHMKSIYFLQILVRYKLGIYI